MMKYYLYQNKQTQGPFDPEQLLLQPGFSKSSLICPVGATSVEAWKPAETYAELISVFEPVSQTTTNPNSAAHKIILIVDDDPSVASFIEMNVVNEGFKTMVAHNGIEATSKCDQTAPDLIITDLKMPQQGGYEFLRSLQANGHGKIPVFVVTGSTLNSTTIELIKQEGNVVEFMSKPLKIPKFILALHQHLNTEKATISPRAVLRQHS